MRRCALLLIFCLGFVRSGHGQKEESLTKEFASLSPKERSRLAKQEEADALKDTTYQGLMARAETAFKAGRYEDARNGYVAARERRPLNVYPKVKLEDLDALIAKKAREQEQPTSSAAATAIPPPVPADSADRTVKWTYSASSNTLSPEPVETKTPDPPLAPLPAAKKEPASVPSEGERAYMEGHAQVLEITVVENEKPITYKKVKHPWGQVFYFRDGSSVGERVWKERFPDR